MAKKPASSIKLNKPPNLYTIYKPNELIKAKKFNMNFIEKQVYYEILDNNHVSTPEVTVYEIPYELVLNPNDILYGNRKTNAKRISEALMKRTFTFDSTFMKKQFGSDSEAVMNPFPEVNCFDDHFKVHVWPRFKKILTLVGDGIGFTKGDRDTLRSFKHEVTDEFYWLIRQRQAFHSTWEVELEDLKEQVGLQGRYAVYQNFKTKILDAVKEDCIGTWVEFDYKPLRKGKGGAVKSIMFYFKNGQKQEKEIPAGQGYPWEERLLGYGVESLKVKEIRSRVKVNQQSEKGFVWDSDYVRFSLEGMTADLQEKKKGKKPVQNIGGWLYNGLNIGQWLEYVKKRQDVIRTEVQQTLSFSPQQEPAPIETVKLKDVTNSSITILSEEGIEGFRELYFISPDKHLPFDEFLNKNNYFLHDGKWVKTK